MSAPPPAPSGNQSAVVLFLSDSPAVQKRLQERIAKDLPGFDRLVKRSTHALQRADPESAVAYLALLRSGIDKVLRDLSDFE
jgi:hypothetical protein